MDEADVDLGPVAKAGEQREEFGFVGTPIEVSVKMREKRGRP